MVYSSTGPNTPRRNVVRGQRRNRLTYDGSERGHALFRLTGPAKTQRTRRRTRAKTTAHADLQRQAPAHSHVGERGQGRWRQPCVEPPALGAEHTARYATKLPSLKYSLGPQKY